MPQKPKKKEEGSVARVLRFDVELWTELQEIAKEDGNRTVASLIRKILDDYVKGKRQEEIEGSRVGPLERRG